MQWTSAWLAALAMQQPASPPPTDTLAPIGKWLVDYNDGECTLARTFGDPSAPITLAFRPSLDMVSGEMAVVLPSVDKGGLRTVPVGLRLLPADIQLADRAISVPMPSGPGRVVRIGAEPRFWTALPQVRRIDAAIGGRKPLRLAIGAMAGALAAVRSCSEDLLVKWGGDPAALIRPPDDAVIRMFNSNDYPDEARRKGQQGRVVVLSTIGVDGKPVRCAVMKSSGVASLDWVTCECILQRGRFAPAGDGGPAKRYLVSSVAWIM